MYIHNFCYKIIGVNIENTTIMSTFICYFCHYFFIILFAQLRAV